MLLRDSVPNMELQYVQYCACKCATGVQAYILPSSQMCITCPCPAYDNCKATLLQEASPEQMSVELCTKSSVPLASEASADRCMLQNILATYPMQTEQVCNTLLPGQSRP
ncbi:hypothetical protein ABBQ32_14190 [Trebouxia sp. C0010 RCD-2024]